MPITNEMLSEIHQLLKQCFTHLSVEYFPENPADYRLNHPIGAILVSYSGSNYQAENIIGGTSTQRKLLVSITVLMRSLNGDKGAITTIDMVRDCLNGHQVEGAFNLITCNRDRFIGNANGIWQYLLDVEFTQLIRS
jgi:hypothetical protein